jgi:organic hydroperoxide reductase OsmC/OhrA
LSHAAEVSRSRNYTGVERSPDRTREAGRPANGQRRTEPEALFAILHTACRGGFVEES